MSFIRLKGKIGGLSFYESNGEALVREAGGVDKHKIMNDPAFKRTRENMSEFGGSATVGKALRMGLLSVSRLFAGRNMTGRLTRIMKEINKKGSGIRGKRAFDFVTNRSNLIDFEFNSVHNFDSLFLAPYSVSVNQDKNQAQIVIPSFDSSDYINAPQGATHCRLVCAISVLSNYGFDDELGKYVPINPNMNKLNANASSADLEIGNMIGEIQIQCNLPNNPQLDDTSALVVCVGIEFMQQIDGRLYSLKSDCAMKIREVA